MPIDDTKKWARFGGFSFDLTSHILYFGNDRTNLPETAARVLGLLLRHHGDVVTHEQIRRAVWGDRHVDFESSLHTAIRSIRRVLGDDAASPRFVETLPRRGYKFLVTPVFADERTASRSHVPPPYQTRTVMGVALAAVAIVMTLGIWGFSQEKYTRPHDPISPVSSPGYDSFLHGRHALSQKEFSKAEQYFTEAIDADPSLAAAYSALGRTKIALRWRGWTSVLTGRQLIEQAIELEPSLARAHMFRGGAALYYWRDVETARRALARARELDPGDPYIYKTMAYLHIIEGQTKQALASIAVAHRLDPLSPALNADYGWIHYKARNWDDAEHLCKTSFELDPTSRFALDCIIHVNHSQRDHAEAAEYGLYLMALERASDSELSRIRQIGDSHSRERAFWTWRLGNLENHSEHENDYLSKRAIILTMLERFDEAVDIFDRAFEKKGEAFLSFLAVDPRVDELRRHPDFERLARLSRTSIDF